MKLRFRSTASDPFFLLYYVIFDPIVILANFASTSPAALESDLRSASFETVGAIASIGVFFLLKFLLGKINQLNRPNWFVIWGFGLSVTYTMQFVSQVLTRLYDGGGLYVPVPSALVVILGFVISTGSTLLIEAQQKYNGTRQSLIAKRVQDKFASSANASPLLSDFVNEAKKTIIGLKGSQTSELSEKLKDLVDSRLRPVSHKLWRSENEKLRRFSTRSLIRRVITRPFEVPELVGLMAVVAAARSELSEFGPQIGWARIVTLYLVVVISIRLQRVVYKRFQLRKLGVLNFLASAAISALLVMEIPNILFGTPEGQLFWRYWLLAAVILSLTAMGTGIFMVTREYLQKQQELVQELEEVDDSDLEHFLSSLRAKDDADYLHSTTQNKLLALAAKLDSSPGTETKEESLVEALAILDESLNPPRETGSDIVNTLRSLQKAWSGLAAINFEVEQDLDLTSAQCELLGMVAREAIGNAYRHGKAKNIEIRITSDSGRTLFVCLDDGSGPKKGEQGLGSALYSTAGSWSLSKAESGSSLRIELAN